LRQCWFASKIYGVGFPAAIVAAAGNLGRIIPPSNAMIVYAYMAGSSVSVAGLFMAGVVPGILLTLGMMAIVHVMAKRRGYPLTGEPVTGAKILRELRQSWVILLMPVMSSEASWRVLLRREREPLWPSSMPSLSEWLVTRKLKLKDLPDCLLKAAITTAIVAH